jgi:hypothetical protein
MNKLSSSSSSSLSETSYTTSYAGACTLACFPLVVFQMLPSDAITDVGDLTLDDLVFIVAMLSYS